jgi:alkylation response protein AidB-like acyl-CoA dehydrogenase
VTWHGPVLSEEQREVRAVLDSLASDNDTELDDARPEQIEHLRSTLVKLGLWTVGTAEQDGGGGASHAVASTVFERLGRTWPALGWAAVQAHAAIDVLGADRRWSALRDRVHAGHPVAVVDASADHVRLSVTGDSLTGVVDRVDTCGRSPVLIVLDGLDETWVITDGIDASPLPGRTGLGGALTRSLLVEATIGKNAVGIRAGDFCAARARLQLGAAAVAAGIAGAAVDGAVEYAASRQQFGDSLTALPTVRKSLFMQAAQTSAVLASVFAADRTQPVAVAAALETACDTAIDVAAMALQCHGGYGYLTDYPAERYLRDAVSLRAATNAPGMGGLAASGLVGRELPRKTTKEPA